MKINFFLFDNERSRHTLHHLHFRDQRNGLNAPLKRWKRRKVFPGLAFFLWSKIESPQLISRIQKNKQINIKTFAFELWRTRRDFKTSQKKFLNIGKKFWELRRRQKFKFSKISFSNRIIKILERKKFENENW